MNQYAQCHLLFKPWCSSLGYGIFSLSEDHIMGGKTVNVYKKIIDGIGLLLEKTGSFSSDNTETTVYCLYVTNYLEKRIIGKIILGTIPAEEIYPGDSIMISVKPEGTITTEFNVTRPIASEKPELLITIQPDEGSKLTVRFEE
jgi:hypothetical protein